MKKSIWVAGLSIAIPALGMLLTACGKEEPPAEQPAPPVTQAAQPQQTTPVEPAAAAPVTEPPGDTAVEFYSPESLESLLAPVALYPDPVLAQVLATSTNPQEVLDAGNWLLQNADLTGADLESAALSVGFTPPMVALVQFPTVVDMMCMEMDWTTELGSAFLADEPGVLNAVQRLRQQASEMGNLESSEQMKVSNETQNNQQVIIVEPAQPEVVYVPQYDPAAVYTTPAPAPTTSTTAVDSSSEGHSTGALITTGLLAFGAGILVNEIFDDDDDNYYYPAYGYGYGRPPYYPPPYRPRYGNGYRPAHGYNRPNNYKNSFNNNNIYINTGDNSYFNQFDKGKNNYRNQPKSPISAARPNRPELDSLNQRSRTQAAARPTAAGGSGYAGAGDRVAQRPSAGTKTPAGSYAGAKPGARDKVAQRPATAVKPPTGSYAGANRSAANMSKPKTAGARDRGRVDAANRPQSVARPTQSPASRKASPTRTSGLQGAGSSGKAERAASQRGRNSMSWGNKRPGTGKPANRKGMKR
mgnify:FL=1